MKAAPWITFLSLGILTAGAARAADFHVTDVPSQIGVDIKFTGPGPGDSDGWPEVNRYLDALQATGVGFVRTIVVPENMPINSQTGERDYSRYDNLISACAQRGIRVYGVLTHHNWFVQKDYDGYAAYFKTPEFRNDFTQFASDVAGRYANYDMTWELWNEPNYGFWPGGETDPTDYLKLALGTTEDGNSHPEGLFKAIRVAAPSATIVAPALSWAAWEPNITDANNYLDACLSYTSQYGSHGILDTTTINGQTVPLIDAVSVHPYRATGPETFAIGDISQPDSYAYLRDKIVQHSPNPNNPIKIVSGEWGYTNTSQSLQTQADYAARMMLTNVTLPDVPLSNYYELWNSDLLVAPTPESERHFGLINFDLTPKPAFYAMRTLTDTLKTATYYTKLDGNTSNDWLTVFRAPTSWGQKEILAAWTTGDNSMIHDVPWWGSFLLTQTPLYLGQALTWYGGANGNWSSGQWTADGSWPNGHRDNYQAVFSTSGATINVDGSYKISGLQFNTDNVILWSNTGGKLVFTSGGGNVYVGGNGAGIYAEIAGGGDPSTFQLRKCGPGALALGAENTFHGGVLIGEGSIHLNHVNAVKNNTVTVNVTNGLLFGAGIGSTFTLGGLAGNGGFALTDTSGVPIMAQVGNNNLDSTYSGVLSGGGSLKKIGSGLLTLTGQNTYTGGTTISEGRLQFGVSGSAPSGAGSIMIESGGVLVGNGAYSDARRWINSGRINTNSTGVLATAADIPSSIFGTAINMSNYAGLSLGSIGDYTLSRNITPANNTYRFGGGGGTLNVAIDLSGGRSLVTAGNVTLSGSNSYTNGTTVNAGNLQFATISAIPTTGTTTINAGGAVLAAGAYTTVADWLDGGKGRIDLGSTGALALTGDSSETIDMGNYDSLSLGAAGNCNYSGQLTPANNTYRFGGGGGALTVSSDLSNGSTARGLVTTGNVTLTGWNSYTGATVISGGTTTLSGYGSIASSSGITVSDGGTLLQNSAIVLNCPLILASGGTLGGTGTYVGNLTVGNGAHLSPGSNSVGALTISGNVYLDAGSVLDYDLGTSSAQVALDGHSLILDGTLNVWNSDMILPGSYTIFSGASSITDHGLDFGVISDNHQWSYQIVNNGGAYSVVVTAAPEPGTWALMMTGVLGRLAYRWQKRR